MFRIIPLNNPFKEGRCIIAKKESQVNNDWLDLCKYVKDEILQYSNDMKFPKNLALRLKGLSQGKYMANNSVPNEAEYSFKIILATCKLCRPKILDYLHNNSTKIKDENHVINIILKIVESEINDVSQRYKMLQKQNEKIENVELNHQVNNGADYKGKSSHTPEKLNKLW